jgi:hypothetical protein
MAVSVRIDLSPPPQDDVVALRIYEAPAEAGPYTQIERTSAVGVYPTYISHYTTVLALSTTDWFKIAWEYTNNVIGPQSQAVQGGQGPLLIGKVIERVIQRDGSLNEGIVSQEAEGVIESYFGQDPYDPELTTNYKKLNGLVLMTLYRSQLVRMLSTTTSMAASGPMESFTIGLVSAKSGTGSSTSSATSRSEDALSKLLDLAWKELEVPLSIILQLAEPCSNGLVASYDHSRLLGWVGVE